MLDFEQFYLNTRSIVYHYLYQQKDNFFEMEDIAQEAYLLALEDWETLQNHPNPAGWLVQTAKHITTGYRRRAAFNVRSLNSEEGDMDIWYEEPAFEQLLMEDLLERVYGAKELPIAKKYFLDNDTPEDLAMELGVSNSSMRSRLYRLRRRLKSYIESGIKM